MNRSFLSLLALLTACGAPVDDPAARTLRVGGSGFFVGEHCMQGFEVEGEIVDCGPGSVDGELYGFAVDFAAELCERLSDTTCTNTAHGWGPSTGDEPTDPATEPSAFTALLRDDLIDIIVSDMGYTPERDMVMDFVLPYSGSREPLVVLPGSPLTDADVASLPDGTTICIFGGTPFTERVQNEYGAGVVLVETEGPTREQDCVDMLVAGDVDGTALGYAFLKPFIDDGTVREIDYNVGADVPSPTMAAIREGWTGDEETPGPDEINAAIREIVEDGTWHEINDMHGGTRVEPDLSE